MKPIVLKAALTRSRRIVKSIAQRLGLAIQPELSATLHRVWRMRRAWLPGLIALATLLLVYSGTLQRDVNGSGHDYMIDVGEIQVALNLWGTIHYTGYPIFTILGALLTHVLRTVGFSPATAASAVATLWSLLGLAGVYWLIARVTEGAYGLAALATLALGLAETFWVHSVVAEVYSFSLLLISATLLVGIELANHWDERLWWLAMALLGTSAEHHRMLVLLIPCVFLLPLPALWQRRSNWLVFSIKSTLVFALPFLAYLYLPLRALQGSPWVYGQPGTWDGFWTEFSGRAVTPYLLKWPGNLAAWLDNLHFLASQLQQQLPAIVLLAGIAGLIWLTWRRAFWTGLGLLAGTFAFMAFVAVFPRAVWAPVVLMPSLLLLVLGLAVLLQYLAQIAPPLRWGTWAGLVLLSLWLFRTNLPFVHSLVNDRRGREVIQMLQPLKGADLPGGYNVVALPWGGTYFAAAYGLDVTGELGGFELVDHMVDFRSIVQQEGKIITLAFNLGNWPLYWWVDLLGEAHFSSAAPGVAMISRDVLYKNIPLQTETGFDLGNGVRIRAADLSWEEKNGLRVTIYWEATRHVRSDYRVAIHLVSRVPPESAQDVLAQADSLNPVGGWYPTSMWATGEVVRDDYTLTVPPDTFPVAVRAAMYQLEESGAPVNTDWLSLPIPAIPEQLSERAQLALEAIAP